MTRSTWSPYEPNGHIPRPYPLRDLATVLGIHPDDTHALALALDLHRATVNRARTAGLTADMADRYAVAAGLHARNVWPNWGGGTELPPAGAANAAKTHCPRGHTYDRTEAIGWRRCSRCRAATKRGHTVRKMLGRQLVPSVVVNGRKVA